MPWDPAAFRGRSSALAIAIRANLAIVKRIRLETNDAPELSDAPLKGLRIAELIAEVSRQFIDLPAQEIDPGIDGALRAIVDALGFDRGVMTAVPPAKDALIVTHRYHARAPRRHIEVGDPLPLLALPWSTSQVLAGIDVRIADATTIGAHAPVDAARLAEAGIRAIAGLPVVVGGQVTAALILISEKPSDLVYLESLRTVVRIFASALDKKRLDMALEWRLRLSELVGRVSRRLIDVPVAELRQSVDDALRQIAELCDFKRAILYELTEDRQRFSITHRYLAPGLEPRQPMNVEQPIERFSYVASRLNLKEPMVISAEGPPETAAIREELIAGGMTHVLLIPLVVGTDPFGVVGFDAMAAPDPTVVEMLGVVGELLTSALHRERVEQGLIDRLRFEEALVADRCPTHRLEPRIVRAAGRRRAPHGGPGARIRSRAGLSPLARPEDVQPDPRMVRAQSRQLSRKAQRTPHRRIRLAPHRDPRGTRGHVRGR